MGGWDVFGFYGLLLLGDQKRARPHASRKPTIVKVSAVFPEIRARLTIDAPNPPLVPSQSGEAAARRGHESTKSG